MAPTKEVNLTDAVLTCRKEADDKAREEKMAADANEQGVPDNPQIEPSDLTPDATAN